MVRSMKENQYISKKDLRSNQVLRGDSCAYVDHGREGLFREARRIRRDGARLGVGDGRADRGSDERAVGVLQRGGLRGAGDGASDALHRERQRDGAGAPGGGRERAR